MLKLVLIFRFVLIVTWPIQLAKALAPYDLLWIEECLPPDDYDGYAALKSALTGTCLVTTGEHEYTRYGFRELYCAQVRRHFTT